ncbi:MAG: hypothetical protein LBU57_03515 [Dysgonamonadaceae bacterium]|jgi:hypothetical protein|nr:hypothetical protein [Dysgonamonadaceae bacterium]
MKKLFVMGVILACSMGLSTAGNEDPAVQICWHNSCGQMHCGIYYLNGPASDLRQDIANSENDCPPDEASEE